MGPGFKWLSLFGSQILTCVRSESICSNMFLKCNKSCRWHCIFYQIQQKVKQVCFVLLWVFCFVLMLFL